MDQSVARKIAYPNGYLGGKHSLGISAIKNLPSQLEDPLAITNNTERQNKSNPLKSIVVWTNWEVGGRSIIVPISIDSQGKITLVNDIKTMFDAGENYYDGFIKAGVLYTKNNEDIKQLLSSRRHMPAAMADDVFADILSKAGEDVNKNVDYGYSSVSPAEDAEYMSLATKQNRTEDENARIQQMVETAAEKSMPNSKLRDKNGKLMLFYHGTNQGDFTVFDWNETQRADAGFFGRGHYFLYASQKSPKNVFQSRSFTPTYKHRKRGIC